MRFNFKKFGEAVKFKRTAGLTTHDKPYNQKDVMAECGVDYVAISRIENGKSASFENVLFLSVWAGLNIYDFIEK